MRNEPIFLADPRVLASPDLDRIRAIYEASFSPSVKEPFEMLAESIVSGTTDLYLATDGDTVGGFALTMPLGLANVSYLTYLAVDPDQRGRGTGGALFRFLREDVHRRRGTTELLWEVERPDPDATLDDANHRRIAFYRRHGGVLLDRVGDYRMPDLASPSPSAGLGPSAGPGTLPAALMWTSVVDRPPLTRHELEAFVVALYRAGYGLEPNDALVRSVLRSIR